VSVNDSHFAGTTTCDYVKAFEGRNIMETTTYDNEAANTSIHSVHAQLS